MTTKWRPAATTMELLSRASAADEANRPMGIDELLLLPPELSPDSGAGPLMDDFNGAVAEWRRQRAEAAAAKKGCRRKQSAARRCR